jgi:hypothetical protein
MVTNDELKRLFVSKHVLNALNDCFALAGRIMPDCETTDNNSARCDLD